MHCLLFYPVNKPCRDTSANGADLWQQPASNTICFGWLFEQGKSIWYIRRSRRTRQSAYHSTCSPLVRLIYSLASLFALTALVQCNKATLPASPLTTHLPPASPGEWPLSRQKETQSPSKRRVPFLPALFSLADSGFTVTSNRHMADHGNWRYAASPLHRVQAL